MRKFGSRGEKCIGSDQFDKKICSDYAEKNAVVLVNLTRKHDQITRSLLYQTILCWNMPQTGDI